MIHMPFTKKSIKYKDNLTDIKQKIILRNNAFAYINDNTTCSMTLTNVFHYVVLRYS